jgi:hypothetical protein
MRRWLGRGALVALVFALCWGGAVWYWRATNRMPAAGDLALYLLILPVGLLLAVWLGRRLVAVAAAAPVAAAEAAAPDLTPPPAQPPLVILDAALRLPHADNAGKLAAALADASARPALDARFVDNNGYPVMTARADSAQDPSVQAACHRWLNEQGMGAVAPDTAQWRALILATGAVADLAGPAAAAWLDADAPMLRVVALTPSDWPAPLRRATAQWLGHTVVAHGWPASQVSVAADDGGAAVLLQRLAAAPPGPQLTLLFACDSRLEQATVDAWADAETLFTSATPQGLIPGEGAAALLLADQLQAVRHGAVDYTLLHALAFDHRAQSADASKRADATLLAQLSEQVLARSSIPAANVKLIVADSGQRVTRVLEVAGVIDAAVPHLDTGDDVLALGAASGTCGAVPFVAALVLSHQQARERAAPVLCVGNEDPLFRCAALIGPAALAS